MFNPPKTHGVRKVTKDLQSGARQESGMGYRVPFRP
jgi:hypothetical protein